MKRIAIVGTPGAWSTERLAEQVTRRTGSGFVVDMQEVVLDLDRGKVTYGDSDLAQLDAVIVKKVGVEYSPAFLDRLGILGFLAAGGTRVFSKPEKMITLVNRLNCTMALKNAGVPIPPTTVTEDPEKAVAAVEEYGTAILKPLFTSKAQGMMVVTARNDTLQEIESFKEAGNPIIYVQKMVEIPDRDLGVAFMGEKYLGTYARIRGRHSWNTTIRSGGKYASCQPGAEALDVADRARSVFGLDFSCIDMVETEDGPLVFEVSAFGAFRGLLEGCGLDIAEIYVDYVLEVLGHG